jgi:hypothetical protein
MKTTHSYPLVKLPESVDLVLYLIREDLKSQKFFNALSKAGLDDCYYQPRLGNVILKLLHLDDGSDEIFEFYFSLIERRSRKIKADNDSVMKQALKVYGELKGRSTETNK